jgi:hypothetical protein
LNQKAGLYATGQLGPTHLVTLLDGEQHRVLRKALSNAPWAVAYLKKQWEPRFDDHISLFMSKMREHAAANRVICLSDKCTEFAVDIMSMVSFSKPFGCVQNQRDEKNMIANFRQGLTFFGFAGRFRFFRENILKSPKLAVWFLPAPDHTSGMGWLMSEADRQLTSRERQIDEKSWDGKPDLLQ